MKINPSQKISLFTIYRQVVIEIYCYTSVDLSPRLGSVQETFGQVIIEYNDNANGEIFLSPANPSVPENTTTPFLYVSRFGGTFGEVKCLISLRLLNATKYRLLSSLLVCSKGLCSKKYGPRSDCL